VTIIERQSLIIEIYRRIGVGYTLLNSLFSPITWKLSNRKIMILFSFPSVSKDTHLENAEV
jgi:hypothetical protein